MDLLQLQLKKLSVFFRYILLFSSTLLLISCASTVAKQPEIVDAEVEDVVETVQEPVEEEPVPLPLTSEIVYYILMAEVAGQRGEIGVATELYSKAADLVESPSLAMRSTQIANYTRDSKRVNKAIERWLEVDPDNADVYLLQLPSLILQNEIDAVIKSINKALMLDPENHQKTLEQVADSLSDLLPPDKALSVFQQIDLYQQNDFAALLTYAQLTAFYNRYELTLPVVNQVLEQQENHEAARILKAETLQRLSRGNEALALLKKEAAKESASNDLLFSYAKLLGENHQAEQAYEIFEQLHEQLPENEEILFALGLLALEQKQGVRAKKYFSQLVAMGDPGQQASYFMGLAEELEENNSAALIWFASVPSDSSRFQAAQGRYINLLADNGQLDKARLHLKLLRKEQPEQAIQYYLFEGTFLREREQHQAAFDLYTQALIENPNQIELLYGRAMVSEGLNRLAIFEEDLKLVLEQDPNNASVLNALGYTLTDRTNRHVEALILIQKAIDISPEDPFYLDSLGWVYYRMGDLKKATKYLKQAVAIQNDAEFLAHLGEVLWVEDKKSEAKRIWMQAIEQDKDNKLLNETLRRFGQQ